MNVYKAKERAPRDTGEASRADKGRLARRLIGGIFIGAVCIPGILFVACSVASTPDMNEEQSTMQYLSVRVYGLTFDAAPDMNSTYEEEDVAALFEEVNSIWSRYGIEWAPEPLERIRITEAAFPQVTGAETGPIFRRQLARAFKPGPETGIWHVALIRQFPVPASGLYIPRRGTVFYAELNRHGVRSPVVLAHELGHALGLKHVEDEDNLMYGGREKDPDRVLNLSPAQVRSAQAQARRGPFRRALATDHDADLKREPRERRRRNADPTKDFEQRRKAVERMSRYDRNGDGRIHRRDVPPNALRLFDRMDVDANGIVDSSELDRFLRGP